MANGLGSLKPTLIRVSHGFLCLILNVGLMSLGYDIEQAGTEEFANNKFLNNLWFISASFVAMRF